MDNSALNLLAMTADAEQRATATLVEMVAAAALMKLDPPANMIDVVKLTITQADFNALMADFRFDAAYDDGGTMTISLTPVAR